MIGSEKVKCLMIGSGSAGILSPWRGFCGRDRAVHGDWSREVDQAAGAAEACSRGAGEGDVGVLVTDRQEEAELSPLHINLYPTPSSNPRDPRTSTLTLETLGLVP